jgi:Transposase IS116/IS110/IS902 family
VLAFTIAAEIGDIGRFATAKKLVGYTGLCPKVNQSGDGDRRGPLSKHGPKYLRWAMLEATMHALRHPAYADRCQRTEQRLGRQRGAKVAQIDSARRRTEAIWHMLTTNQPFTPLREAPLVAWQPDGPFGIAPPRPASHDAALELAGPAPELAGKFPTAALATLTFDGSAWGELGAEATELVELTRPRDL